MQWNYAKLGCKCLKCIRDTIQQGIYWILRPFSTYPFWSTHCLITTFIMCFIESHSRCFNTPLLLLFWCNTLYLSSNLPYLALHFFHHCIGRRFKLTMWCTNQQRAWLYSLSQCRYFFSCVSSLYNYVLFKRLTIMCYSKNWIKITREWKGKSRHKPK